MDKDVLAAAKTVIGVEQVLENSREIRIDELQHSSCAEALQMRPIQFRL